MPAALVMCWLRCAYSASSSNIVRQVCLDPWRHWKFPLVLPCRGIIWGASALQAASDIWPTGMLNDEHLCSDVHNCCVRRSDCICLLYGQASGRWLHHLGHTVLCQMESILSTHHVLAAAGGGIAKVDARANEGAHRPRVSAAIHYRRHQPCPYALLGRLRQSTKRGIPCVIPSTRVPRR